MELQSYPSSSAHVAMAQVELHHVGRQPSGYPIVYPSFQNLQEHGPTKENDIMELSKIKALAQLYLGSRFRLIFQ